jgi:DNA-binding transcriptional LysR family regulator
LGGDLKAQADAQRPFDWTNSPSCAIADAGSLARAARKLGRSPPALTRALAVIEARAGVRLVERTTRRLALTEAGRRLVDRARALIAGCEAAVGRSCVGTVARDRAAAVRVSFIITNARAIGLKR